jgi:hypothetical protein
MTVLYQRSIRAVCSRFECADPVEGRYGSKDSRGLWNGVIGMIVNMDFDVGLNVLDLDNTRMDAVDFFPPLWNLK